MFLDGIGLGEDDPSINPFARAKMPVLSDLMGGRRLLKGSAPLDTDRVSVRALDACLGVSGLPQSATGQAVLLSGQNVPATIGRHYGPKPNKEIADFIKNGNLFNRLKSGNISTAFLNAYPPGYFEAIQSGRRMYAAFPLAVVYAGLPLRTIDDLEAGEAISADFTAQGWHTHLKLSNTPVLSPPQAGKRLSKLAGGYDFSFFEYWLSDYAGHSQDMNTACDLLETFDQVLGNLVSDWEDKAGLILITSDHGNMEDLSTRRHTKNPVPAIVIGEPEPRNRFTSGLHNITDVAPAILDYFAQV